MITQVEELLKLRATPVAYRGAVRQRASSSGDARLSCPGFELWRLTGNDAEILAAEDEDVLWVETALDLRDAMEARHPAATFGGRLLSRVSDESHYSSTMVVYPHPIADRAEAAKAAVELGAVCVLDCHDVYALRRKLGDTGCRVTNPAGIVVVSYDEKTAARIIAKRQKQRAKQYVTVHDIIVTIRKLEGATNPPFPRPGTYGVSSRTEYVNFLAGRLVLLNLLYGKGAHRRFGPWQEFVAKWRERKEVSDRAFSDAKLAHFVEFMDKECRARRVTPLPAKHYAVDKRPTTIRLP